MKIASDKKIYYQKTLFDDGNSEELYLKKEIKKRREKEVKEKEKNYLAKKAKENQTSLADVSKVIKNNLEQYDNMLIKIFGDKNVFKDWLKR